MAYIDGDDMLPRGTLAYVAGVSAGARMSTSSMGVKSSLVGTGERLPVQCCGVKRRTCMAPSKNLGWTAKNKTLQVKLWAGELRLSHGI